MLMTDSPVDRNSSLHGCGGAYTDTGSGYALEVRTLFSCRGPHSTFSTSESSLADESGTALQLVEDLCRIWA